VFLADRAIWAKDEMDELISKSLKSFTERDLDAVTLYGATIHAMAFDTTGGDLLLDIDYIDDWVKPTPPRRDVRVSVAPATLVFHNVYGLEADILVFSSPFVISKVSKDMINDKPSKNTTWIISTERSGRISFLSSGFILSYRSEPTLLDSDKFMLTSQERGGFSFGLG